RSASAGPPDPVKGREARPIRQHGLGWSLPTLGFIGTVLGLGTALLTAGDMVTPVSELQRDAIQTVSIYLGRAFDKTFIALLLSLVIMAFIYAVRHAEEAVVLTFHEQITRGVVRRLRGYMPRPPAA
ncbi:MAG: MotA/TolQ/ExbB proton channel family protein, partial [Gemmataceae bacterium]|nr:MotA/TolQ/ExbB proton channel family protein [Gemmataceae bacterium]